MNTLFVVVDFLALVTVITALAGLAVAGRTWRRCQTGKSPGSHADRDRLLLLLGLIVLNVGIFRVLSGPVLLSGLDHQAAAVPGAMCAYGVMQVTPVLTTWLLILKGLTLLSLTTGFLLARAQRQDGGAGMARAVLAVTLLALTLALADAAVDTAFVHADRGEVSVTCCSSILDLNDRLTQRVTVALFGPDVGDRILALYVAATLAAVLAGAWTAAALRRGLGGASLWALVGTALLSLSVLPLGVLVSMEHLAPAVLHLPHHHCPLEAWTGSLDGPLILAMLVAGSLVPCAALVVACTARTTGAHEAVPQVGGAALCAAAASAGALVMVLVHLCFQGVLS